MGTVATVAGVIDLHSHTTSSDGDLSPTQLVARAAQRGVTVLGVTDHDTMVGVPEASEAATRWGIEVVPGVEISVTYSAGSLHLLGYFPEAAPEPLTSRLRDLAAARRSRAEEVVRLLGALGAPITMADIEARAGGTIGRPHVAEALIAAGHVATRQEAFDRFLHDHGPAWVPHTGILPDEAVQLVRDSGGAPVLAHPGTLRLGTRQLDGLVAKLTHHGLVGIEVHRPEHLPDQHAAYRKLARRHNLIMCGGSDFHRPGDGREPGDTGDPPLKNTTHLRLAERVATVGP
jgi:3',5'-nucleoside bisphosphate phosphatase